MKCLNMKCKLIQASSKTGRLTITISGPLKYGKFYIRTTEGKFVVEEKFRIIYGRSS